MTTAPPNQTTRNVLFIVLGVLGLGGIAGLACCGGVAWLGSKAAAEVPPAQAGVELFLDRIADGESDLAYQATTTAFRSTISQGDFDGFRAALPRDVSRAARTMKFLRINNTNGVTQIVFQVVSGGKTCKITALKEDGDWKVHHIAVP